MIHFQNRHGERLHGILKRALHAHGLHRRLPRRLAPEVWAAAVGAQIAARAQPTTITAGTLHVLVQDYRWRDQLDAARNFLIERLNQRLGPGTVQQLQFGLAHTGALDEARKKLAVVHTAPEPVQPERVLGGAQLDPMLREAVLRAAEAQRAAARA